MVAVGGVAAQIARQQQTAKTRTSRIQLIPITKKRLKSRSAGAVAQSQTKVLTRRLNLPMTMKVRTVATHRRTMMVASQNAGLGAEKNPRMPKPKRPMPTAVKLTPKRMTTQSSSADAGKNPTRIPTSLQMARRQRNQLTPKTARKKTALRHPQPNRPARRVRVGGGVNPATGLLDFSGPLLRPLFLSAFSPANCQCDQARRQSWHLFLQTKVAHNGCR